MLRFAHIPLLFLILLNIHSHYLPKVYSEWSLNNGTALELFANNLSNPNFNRESVITPSISGLFNGEALRAMWDLGIRNVVGIDITL
jgi:hypothetical protein